MDWIDLEQRIRDLNFRVGDIRREQSYLRVRVHEAFCVGRPDPSNPSDL
jgi:hypothetical protein